MTCHVYRVYRSSWAGYLPFASSTQTLQINMGPWSDAKQDYANFHSCSSRLMVQICGLPTPKISYTSVLAFVSSVARWNDRPAPCCSWFWSSNFQALRFIHPVTPSTNGPREVSERFLNTHDEFDSPLMTFFSFAFWSPRFENADAHPLPYRLCGARSCTAIVICGVGCRLGYFSQTRKWSWLWWKCSCFVWPWRVSMGSSPALR